MQNFNMNVETTLVLQSICTFIVCLWVLFKVPHFNLVDIHVHVRLCQYRVLSSQCYFVSVHVQVPGNDDRNTLNALWGKLGSEILMQNWETALEDLNRLKDVIESNVSFVNSHRSVLSLKLKKCANRSRAISSLWDAPGIMVAVFIILAWINVS